MPTATPKTLAALGAAAGTPAELETVAAAINHFGEANHPWADAGTIRDFAIPYAITCLTRAAHQPGPRAAIAAELATRYRAAFRRTGGGGRKPHERRAAGNTTYYKLSTWDGRSLTYRDGRRAYPTEAAARAAATAPGRYRVSTVADGQPRRDGEPFTVA